MSEHLVTTLVRAVECLRCHAIVLTGYAEGISGTVDPVAIDPGREIDYILQSRETYSLSQGYLTQRDAGRVKSGLPGVIVAQHKCGRPSAVTPPF